MPYTVHPSIEKFMGKTVIDQTTGFKGTAIQCIMGLNGSVMFTIQPRVKADDDGKLPEPTAVDEHLLEVVEDGPVVRFIVPPVEDDDLFAMGNNVLDVHTGFAGTVTTSVMYLNGCIRYLVMPYLSDKLAVKNYPRGQFLDISQLVLDPEVQVEGGEEGATFAGDPSGGPQVRKPGGPMIRGGISR